MSHKQVKEVSVEESTKNKLKVLSKKLKAGSRDPAFNFLNGEDVNFCF